SFFSSATGRTPILQCGFEPDSTLVDNQNGEFRGASDDHNRIARAALSRDGKSTARKGVIDACCEGTLAHDCKLRRSRQRTSDKRAEREDNVRFGRKRIENRSAFIEQKLNTQTTTTNELSQRFFRQRDVLGSVFGGIDSKVRTVVTERHWKTSIHPRQRTGS